MEKRYPIDSCPPKAGQTFEKLCQSFPPESIPQLRVGLSAAMERFSRSTGEFLGPHLATATKIAQRLYYLIDNYQKLPQAKLPLVVGAIRYFIIEDDAVPDSTPIVGFDDDVRVLNHVLEELGLAAMCLEI